MEEIFQRVDQDKSFWIEDGRRLYSLYDLALALRDMKIKKFKFYVNKNKNDFSEWVKNVLNEKELADKLARVVTKDKVELIILRHIFKKLTEKV